MIGCMAVASNYRIFRAADILVMGHTAWPIEVLDSICCLVFIDMKYSNCKS